MNLSTIIQLLNYSENNLMKYDFMMNKIQIIFVSAVESNHNIS